MERFGELDVYPKELSAHTTLPLPQGQIDYLLSQELRLGILFNLETDASGVRRP